MNKLIVALSMLFMLSFIDNTSAQVNKISNSIGDKASNASVNLGSLKKESNLTVGTQYVWALKSSNVSNLKTDYNKLKVILSSFEAEIKSEEFVDNAVSFEVVFKSEQKCSDLIDKLQAQGFKVVNKPTTSK